MRNCLWILFLLPCLKSMSQEAAHKKQPHFQSVNQLGLLEGEGGTYFQIQTINGLKWKSWFAGAGVGLDYYSIRSVPVFASVRKHFLSSEKIFAYTDAGIHFPWVKNTSEGWGWGSYTHNYFPGLYYDLGIGYRLPLRQAALLLSAGYSSKMYTMDAIQQPPCWDPPCLEYKEKFDYTLRRISMKLGISF